MIFSITKKDISDKLQHIYGVIQSKSIMVVLANFKIDADNESNMLTITASDLNITSIIKIPANVVEKGSILVDAKKLCDITSSMPDALINFQTKENQLVIECEKSNIKLSYIESSNFPEINTVGTGNEYVVDAENFKKLIQNTVFCTSSEASQTIVNGVFLKIEDKLITMAATDTKRIGEAKCHTESSFESAYQIVLPTRALNLLEKAISAEAENIVIKCNDNQISFAMENILYISNKFEGKYPDYTVVFKNQPNYNLVIDKNKLKDAVRRVSLLSEDDDKLVKISLGGNEVIIESIISERGNAKESISSFTYDGPECFFCLNSKFLSGFLNVIESDEVVMSIRSSEEPIWILNNVKFDMLEIRFIIMPMRITW